MGGDIVNPFASLASAIQQPQDDQQAEPSQDNNYLGYKNLSDAMGEANLQPPRPVSNIQNLAQAIGGRSGHRLDHFEAFLTNFATAFGSGMGAAQGPNAFGRGLAAAATAPYAQAVQQWQLGQEQAVRQGQLQGMQSENQLRAVQGQSLQSETQQRNLQTQMLMRRLQAMSNPNAQPGEVTFQNMTPDERVVMQNAYRNFQMTGDPKAVNAAYEQIFSQRSQGGRTGLSDIVPDHDSPTGFSRALYNKNGDVTRLQPGVLPPAGWAQKTTTTYQWKVDSNGVYRPLPVTTTTTPGLAGVQAKVPALGAAAPQRQLQKKVPALGGGMESPQAQEPVIAFNPKTNESIWTTRADAAKNGLQQVATAKAGDYEKFRTSQVQFNDVQANVSRYRAAVNQFAREGKPEDGALINQIINDSKIGGGIHLGPVGIEIPGASSLAEATDRVFRSGSYKALSPAGKGLIDGYLRTMAAVPAYQKALTGVGRFNKEIIDLELRNIPDPTYAPADADRKLQAFQENIDQGVSGIPRLPGIPTINDVRSRFEGRTQPKAGVKIPTPFGQTAFSQGGGGGNFWGGIPGAVPRQ
jgi:hypothetical protein